MGRLALLWLLTMLTACGGAEEDPCPAGLEEVFRGCDEAPEGTIFLPEACYEPCEPGADACPAGSSCVKVWFDPCVCPEGEDCCDACGAEGYFCAPGL